MLRKNEKMIKITAYEHDDRLSLDKDFIYNASGGKCSSSEVIAFLTVDSYNKLLERFKRSFNSDYYNRLLENDFQDEAQRYIDNHCKDISLNLKDMTFTGTEQMRDFLEYDISHFKNISNEIYFITD